MVASVLVPVTTKVLVVVLLVVVRLVINAVTAFKSVAKRLDEVAFVLVRFVIVPLVLVRVFAVSAEEEALESVVCPDTVREVADAVASTVWPLTVSAVAEAFPSVEVPEMSVENIPVVNDGLGVTAMVEVPEKRIFAPALKKEIGEL